jgi:hypothetical protein
MLVVLPAAATTMNTIQMGQCIPEIGTTAHRMLAPKPSMLLSETLVVELHSCHFSIANLLTNVDLL